MALLKKRLDLRALELFPDATRAQIQSWIVQGLVTVDGVRITKPGAPVLDTADIVLNRPQAQFVSRAGYKLAGALDALGISVADKVVLDSGISTGGFTDCMLQRDARRVYGVDVGYGIVHESLRHDPRVVLLERTNLRTLTELPELVDLITLDLSFISVTKVIPILSTFLKHGGEVLILIKPQFEATYAEVSRGKGIISDTAIHERVIAHIRETLRAAGFTVQATAPSVLTGSSGNQEFFVYAKHAA